MPATIRILGAVAAVVFVVSGVGPGPLGTAAPASAAGAPVAAVAFSAPAKPAARVAVRGVGWGNEVAVPRALYQCPAFNCNQGQAYPGNDLAEVCTLTLGGVTWGLVFNRANLHTGFIPTNQLIYADPPTNCLFVGQPSAYDPIPENLYQCPAFFCNRGRVNQGDYLRVICEFDPPNSLPWSWVWNATNTHEGFDPYYNMVSNAPSC